MVRNQDPKGRTDLKTLPFMSRQLKTFDHCQIQRECHSDLKSELEWYLRFEHRITMMIILFIIKSMMLLLKASTQCCNKTDPMIANWTNKTALQKTLS